MKKLLKFSSLICIFTLLFSNIILAASNQTSASDIGALVGFITSYGLIIFILAIIPVIGYYKAFNKAKIAPLLAVAGLLFPFFTDYGKAKAAKCMWPFWIQILVIPIFIIMCLIPALGSGSNNDIIQGLTAGVGVIGIVALILGFLISRIVLMVKFIKSYTNTDNIFIILIVVLLLTGGVADVSWLVGYMNCNYKG